MGLVDGMKKAISTAGEQLTSSSPKPQGIYFTNNFQHKAKQWGLSETDALDVVLSRSRDHARTKDQEVLYL
jgi:hypothetical protein